MAYAPVIAPGAAARGRRSEPDLDFVTSVLGLLGGRVVRSDQRALRAQAHRDDLVRGDPARLELVRDGGRALCRQLLVVLGFPLLSVWPETSNLKLVTPEMLKCFLTSIRVLASFFSLASQPGISWSLSVLKLNWSLRPSASSRALASLTALSRAALPAAPVASRQLAEVQRAGGAGPRDHQRQRAGRRDIRTQDCQTVMCRVMLGSCDDASSAGRWEKAAETVTIPGPCGFCVS